ncbi:sporulation protein YabP [Mycoplasmatota bacterium]|nr:sporulation protein YabP [Mycoplasmatota bacterium]
MMEQKIHQLFLKDRKSLEITGVKKIESLNEEEFIVETELGLMSILGRELEMRNLDVDKGELQIKGYITMIEYKDHQVSASKSMFSKLFK